MTKRRKADATREGQQEPEGRAQFRFKTQAQREAWDVISRNTVTFLLGAAGVGKTQIAIAWATQAVLRGEYSQVIQTRPIQEATERLGYMPGGLEMKISYYMVPLESTGKKVPGRETIKTENIPLAFMRGITMESACGILDEAQNCTRAQLQLYISRLGADSRLIICGDTCQADIRDSGLERVSRELSSIPGIGVFHFKKSDTVRHPLLVQILDHPVWVD